jgi:hypothetical protein
MSEIVGCILEQCATDKEEMKTQIFAFDMARIQKRGVLCLIRHT